MSSKKLTPNEVFWNTEVQRNSIQDLAQRFIEWGEERNYSKATITNRKNYLRYFLGWCEERGLEEPLEITKPIIESYQRYLYHYRRKLKDGSPGGPLSFRSQHTRLVPIRAFFKWLAQNNYLLYNPASDIEMPKIGKYLPTILTLEEVETIINLPQITDPIGLRDRAILETLYSTGIRRMEVAHLKVFDIDRERGVLTIRQGKGKKDRVIPIGNRALSWIEKYLDQARSILVCLPDPGFLFLSNQGEALARNHLTDLVSNYVKEADLGKKGSCHLFRHTMATHMLEHGADIRYIQQMLGHAELSTTEIYTQVSIRKLKAIHSATHPAQLKKEKTKNSYEKEFFELND